MPCGPKVDLTCAANYEAERGYGQGGHARGNTKSTYLVKERKVSVNARDKARMQDPAVLRQRAKIRLRN